MDERLKLASAKMCEKAWELGVVGAIVLIIQEPRGGPIQVEFFFWGEWSRPPDPAKEGDVGVNFYSFASGKAFYSLRTGLNSGDPRQLPMKGEADKRGSVIRIDKDGRCYIAAFSGATPEEDVEIANVGINILCPAE